MKRLVELGAKEVAEHSGRPGLAWTVLTDPEGNEFCVSGALTAPRRRAGGMPGGGRRAVTEV